MVKIGRVEGKAKMQRNTERLTQRLVLELERAVMRMGVRVRREGMKKTPVDTGNLRGSWHGPTIEVATKNRGILAKFGLTANYAAKVHEAVGVQFRAPGTGAKFLESALEDNYEYFRKAVKRVMKKFSGK